MEMTKRCRLSHFEICVACLRRVFNGIFSQQLLVTLSEQDAHDLGGDFRALKSALRDDDELDAIARADSPHLSFEDAWSPGQDLVSLRRFPDQLLTYHMIG